MTTKVGINGFGRIGRQVFQNFVSGIRFRSSSDQRPD